MEHEFWHRRWHKNEIGFHQGDINRHLQAHWSELRVPAAGRVFVPLCGKSLDMLWLRAQGHPVVGIEISEVAVADFFRENSLQPFAGEEAGLPWTVADNIRLYCGDYFKLTPGHLGVIAAVYDRASLIALPPEMRSAYARQLAHLTPHDVPALLISMEYDAVEVLGPPFSVHEAEVRELFKDDFDVLHVDSQVDDQLPRHLRERGIATATDKIYYLRRKHQDAG